MKLPFAKLPIQDVEPEKVKWPTVDFAQEAAADIAKSRKKRKKGKQY